jgi:hypothetical protein
VSNEGSSLLSSSSSPEESQRSGRSVRDTEVGERRLLMREERLTEGKGREGRAGKKGAEDDLII